MKLGVVIFADRYTWYLFPRASNRLYGYQYQNNQSFESELLPRGSYVAKEDGVYGLSIPAGERVTLGNFSAGCLGIPGICENFTVSFLFKINGSIPENETVDVIHQRPVMDAGYRVQFSVFQNTTQRLMPSVIDSHYTAVATIARGNKSTEITGVISVTGYWIHVAIVYAGPHYLKLYLNGTNGESNASSVAYSGSATQVNMTLGSPNNYNAVLVSYLQVTKDAISNQADVNSLKDESFTQGKLNMFATNFIRHGERVGP